MHKNAVVYTHPVHGEVWIAPGSKAFEDFAEMNRVKDKDRKAALKNTLETEMTDAWKKSNMRSPT